MPSLRGAVGEGWLGTQGVGTQEGSRTKRRERVGLRGGGYMFTHVTSLLTSQPQESKPSAAAANSIVPVPECEYQVWTAPFPHV